MDNSNYPQQGYQQPYQQQGNKPLPKENVIMLILDFLVWPVGIISYFIRKNKVSNPNSILIAGIAGFAVSFILRLIINAMAS